MSENEKVLLEEVIRLLLTGVLEFDGKELKVAEGKDGECRTDQGV